jgi:hypothetical protein
MESVMVNSEQIRLPKRIASKLKGKSVEFIETEQGILLKTMADPIKAARGILKGSKFSTRRYLQNKKEDKKLEK